MLRLINRVYIQAHYQSRTSQLVLQLPTIGAIKNRIVFINQNN